MTTTETQITNKPSSIPSKTCESNGHDHMIAFAKNYFDCDHDDTIIVRLLGGEYHGTVLPISAGAEKIYIHGTGDRPDAIYLPKPDCCGDEVWVHHEGEEA